jgi:outer membrane lipoprotein-sorting protein
MITRVVFVFLLFICPGLASSSSEKSEPPAVHVESVQADFVQEKQLPILAHPILSKGAIVYRAPASLRWEYFSPIHTVLLMDGGHPLRFVEHGGKFREERGMGVDAMQIVLQEITGWLDGKITETATFRARVEGEGRIILTPKDPGLEKIISRIELKLLGNSGLMESVTLYEGEDSFTRMVFSDAVLNEKVAASRFTEP